MAFRQPMWVNWMNFVFAAASLGLAVGRRVEAPHRERRYVRTGEPQKETPAGPMAARGSDCSERLLAIYMR